MSTYKLINNSYIRCDPSVLIVKTEADAIQLIENSFGTHKLLIFQSNLTPEFFDLSTKLAGEVFQKLVNYGVKTAFVINIKNLKSEHFKELISEANSGSDYAFFASEKEAVAWLEFDI